MRPYELMIILDPSVDERSVGQSMEKLLRGVIGDTGSVEKVDVWGKRRLAYEIKKQSEGVYLVVDMIVTPEIAQEITRQLGLNESVLRTKLLRRDVD